MLTLAQQRAYQFIKKFLAEHGYAPTVMEVARGIGIKSKGVAHRYIIALEQAGKINLTHGRHRNIAINKAMLKNENPTLIPFLGKIAAGKPIEAIVNHEMLDVQAIFNGPNRYALKVQGDSMIEEGIHDGDIVICEQTDTAVDGEIVVALVDGEEATLKRFKNNKDGTISLLPANVNLSTMMYDADRVQIQGRFIGLLRFY